jgi:hypothetical protein
MATGGGAHRPGASVVEPAPLTRASPTRVTDCDAAPRSSLSPSLCFSSAQRSPSAAGTAQPTIGLDARTRGAVSVRCTALLGCHGALSPWIFSPG